MKNTTLAHLLFKSIISFKTSCRKFLLGVCVLLPSIFIYSQIYIGENAIIVQTENRNIVYIEKNKSHVKSDDKHLTDNLDDSGVYIGKGTLVFNANLLITSDNHTRNIEQVKDHKKENNTSVVAKKTKNEKHINNLQRTILLFSKSNNDNDTSFIRFSRNDFTTTNNPSKKIEYASSYYFKEIVNGFSDKILIRIHNQCFINNQYFLNKNCIRPPSFIPLYI